jgi:hypothetical protein
MAKLGCEEINPNQPNFKQPKSILSSLLSLFKIPNTIQTSIPKPLILASKNRPGLSAKLMASKVIQRQAEAGLNVGPLGTGETSPAEIMERIRMEEIVDAITTQMKIDLAIVPGGKSVITGNAGPIPVVGTGTIIDIMGGSAVAS